MIVFCYVEILFLKVEVMIEKNIDFLGVIDLIDLIRERVGMLKVDRVKYNI